MWKEATLKYSQVRLLWQHLAGGTALWTVTFGTVSTLTHDDAALTQQMEHWQNDTDKGRPKCSSEHLSQCHSVQHKSHTDWPEFGERPAWHKIRYKQCEYTRTDWRKLDHPAVWCRRQKVLHCSYLCVLLCILCNKSILAIIGKNKKKSIHITGYGVAIFGTSLYKTS